LKNFRPCLPAGRFAEMTKLILMKKIGITGQAGFVGNHLYTTLSLDETVELVNFDRDFFNTKTALEDFVAQCDCIIHLAAMNRHDDANVIYNTNLKLVDDLIDACINKGATPHIIFSSSSQEDRDNLYGQSKKEGKEKFMQWAAENDGKFTSLTIPNVFGPFGKPNYNSVVATFCHKVARGEEPTIIQDGEVGLIYINELVRIFIDTAKSTIDATKLGENSFEVRIEATSKNKVSTILALLNRYKKIIWAMAYSQI